MRRLLNRDVGPPIDARGYPFRFIDPATNKRSEAMDYYTWQQKIFEHRVGMGIQIPRDMMAIAEDQLCSQLPGHLCQYEEGDAPPIDVRGVNIWVVISWIKAVAKKIIVGFEYVAQEEAERRANICVACPYNVETFGGCGGGCQKLVEHMTPGMTKRQTTQDQRLKSCAVCGCFGRVMVHFPVDILEETSTTEMQNQYPAFCWRKKGGENYKPSIEG